MRFELLLLCKLSLLNSHLLSSLFDRVCRSICIGNSMVSSAIWKKTCTSEFFKDDQTITITKDDQTITIMRNHTITC